MLLLLLFQRTVSGGKVGSDRANAKRKELGRVCGANRLMYANHPEVLPTTNYRSGAVTSHLPGTEWTYLDGNKKVTQSIKILKLATGYSSLLWLPRPIWEGLEIKTPW